MNLAPAGSYLLDTSAVILMMAHRMTAAPKARVPFVVLGELFTGVERAANPDREKSKVKLALGAAATIYPDYETSIYYGWVNAQLYRSGQPIPTNDVWIAALALQLELPVLSSDAHFQRVPGLKFLSAR